MYQNARDIGLHGTLELTNVADLLQFLDASRRNGALGLSRGLGGKKARVYIISGRIEHAASGDLDGLEALAEVMGWDRGDFNFAPDVAPPRKTIEMPLQFALLEAARLRDESRRLSSEALRRGSDELKGAFDDDDLVFSASDDDNLDLAFHPTDEELPEVDDVIRRSTRLPDDSMEMSRSTRDFQWDGDVPATERSGQMAYQTRNSSEVLEDLLKVPGVDAVVVVGRDGFVIESVGSSARLNVDALGASLAHAINGIEEMGSELHIDVFSDLFIEYGRAVLICRPTGDAITVLVTPDASKLGIIRHKAKKHFQELSGLF
jgi:predicted regulator of Ras-like GTPase activity (Roadblock/LC7/MglB family)